jgi:hypothetical protein
VCIELREKIKELESQIIQYRQTLDAHVKALPGLKGLEAKRKSAFAQLKDLREQERLLLEEIKTSELQGQ